MIIPIVDEQDNLLYHKNIEDRDERKEITRSACLWIVNEKKEILLAKRSHKKFNFPNLWGTSASGFVEEGETYEENARKEAQEEIGVIIKDIIYGPKKRESDRHEFFNQYFFARVSSDVEFTLQESEVDEVRWIILEDLENWYKEKPQEFIPTFDKCFEIIKNFNI